MPRQAKTSRLTESRGAHTRAVEKRAMPQTEWEGKLYVPLNEIPEDKVYAWVRVAANNQNDETNMGAKMRKGWKPVPRARHASTFPIFNIPGVSSQQSTNSDVIIVGGQMLCECLKKDWKRRRAEIDRMNMSVLKGVQFAQGLKNQDTPVFDQSGETKIEREIQSEPQFQDD
jgi:hypothetical protein